ncbi:MAG: DEAD/DEAH box helicase [Bacteroidota bacterium]
MQELIKAKLESIRENKIITEREYEKATQLYRKDACMILALSGTTFDVLVEDKKVEKEIKITREEDNFFPLKKKTTIDWDEHSVAALMQVYDKLTIIGNPEDFPGKKYTRAGMIKRVMGERKQRATDAKYKIEFANNIYGEHILYNERGVQYKITLRDFENETGYVNSLDLRTNKLGTTKHIMFAFEKLKKNQRLYKKLDKTYPFVEIYLDPLNDYKITWHYPHTMDGDTAELIHNFFGKSQSLPESETKHFLKFINAAEELEHVKIRSEVYEKVEEAWNQTMLAEIASTHKPDYGEIKADLFNYQKEGVEFALFKKGAIIADEMGLGKTIQALSVAILKKQIFGFQKTLIICPASLKAQWKAEIEKFSDEKAVVVEGFPSQRAAMYRDSDAYFLIINYETVLRDFNVINENAVDFIILDEAQRIKNYDTKTAQSIKQLYKKHALVITGTPIENKLIDLYSIVQFIDPYFLAPLWEFSYQHCYFDEKLQNKIIGYFNLTELKQRLENILIRREKRNVIKELPNLQQITVPVRLHPEQSYYHSSYGRGIAKILSKKFKTPYDMQRLMLLLNSMRRVCNSTFLIDKETNYSPKLIELKHILLDKLEIRSSKRKIIIFSEWVTTHYLLGELLRELNIGYVELTGKVPVKKRGLLIDKFRDDDNCQVFLSTEAGGAGLNLQMADTVINFELPWNPAKKNQRIGRIDRLGQKNNKLTVLNFMTLDSIETKIATGLMLKQNLFEGVLDTDKAIDEVDFSKKGHAQFLKELESFIHEFEEPTIEDMEVPEEVVAENVSDDVIQKEEEMTEDTPAIPSESTAQSPSESTPQPQTATSNMTTQQKEERLEQMEQVMNQGMGFLAGLFKLSTGQDMNTENQKVEIDRKTGEVVMRFKLGL